MSINRTARVKRPSLSVGNLRASGSGSAEVESEWHSEEPSASPGDSVHCAHAKTKACPGFSSERGCFNRASPFPRFRAVGQKLRRCQRPGRRRGSRGLPARLNQETRCARPPKSPESWLSGWLRLRRSSQRRRLAPGARFFLHTHTNNVMVRHSFNHSGASTNELI